MNIIDNEDYKVLVGNSPRNMKDSETLKEFKDAIVV